MIAVDFLIKNALKSRKLSSSKELNNNQDFVNLHQNLSSFELSSGHPNVSSVTQAKEQQEKRWWSGLDNWGGLLVLVLGLHISLRYILGETSLRRADSEPRPVPATPMTICWLTLIPWGMYLHLTLLLCYRIELLLTAGRLSWQTGLPCHMANLTVLFLLPVFCLAPQTHLVGLATNLLVCLVHTMLLMKLVSFIQVNKHMRGKLKAQGKLENQLKTTPHLTNIYYYWFAPTLSYQPSLLVCLSPKVRYRWVFWWLTQLALGQHLVRAGLLRLPVLSSHILSAAEDNQWVEVIERYLGLIVVANLVWMLCFYLLFHIGLNLIAELTRYPNRSFYLSWWGAETVSEFWRAWNLPVHHWFSNHMYKPLLNRGWTKMEASLMVFLTSAVMHEYIASLTLRVAGHTCFLGMLGQVPLAFLTKEIHRKLSSRLANITFWVTIMLGHATGVVGYYHQFTYYTYK